MFSAKTYAARRNMLRTKIGSGIVLFPGNPLSPNNYPNNAYYFRQDSSFLYYFGLNIPSLAGLIDADTGEEALYGDDFTVEDIIWTGPQPTLRELGAKVGIAATHPLSELEKRLRKAISLGRKIHFLPPYRGETKLWLSSLLGIKPTLLHDYKSVDLMFAVAEMPPASHSSRRPSSNTPSALRLCSVSPCCETIDGNDTAREKERRGGRGDGARIPNRLQDAHAGHEDVLQYAVGVEVMQRFAVLRDDRRERHARTVGFGDAFDGTCDFALDDAETEGCLQHRAGGTRPCGRHRQTAHDVLRDTQRRLHDFCFCVNFPLTG